MTYTTAYKIGQKVTVSKEHTIKSDVCGTEYTLKAGDTGFVDSLGWVHFLNGEGKGKINMDDLPVKDYDCTNIARLIMNRLCMDYNLEEILEDYNILPEEFEGTIEAQISEIL